MNESGYKDEGSKNVGGEEVSKGETSSVIREEINKLPTKNVRILFFTTWLLMSKIRNCVNRLRTKENVLRDIVRQTKVRR